MAHSVGLNVYSITWGGGGVRNLCTTPNIHIQLFTLDWLAVPLLSFGNVGSNELYGRSVASKLSTQFLNTFYHYQVI